MAHASSALFSHRLAGLCPAIGGVAKNNLNLMPPPFDHSFTPDIHLFHHTNTGTLTLLDKSTFRQSHSQKMALQHRDEGGHRPFRNDISVADTCLHTSDGS